MHRDDIKPPSNAQGLRTCLIVCVALVLLCVFSISMFFYVDRSIRSTRYIEFDLSPSAAPLPPVDEYTPLVSRLTDEQFAAAERLLHARAVRIEDDRKYFIEFEGAKEFWVSISDRNARIGLHGILSDEIIDFLYELASTSGMVVVVDPLMFQSGVMDVNDPSDLVAVLPEQYNPSIDERWTRITEVHDSEELRSWFRQLRSDGTRGNL